ncbi:MAG: hydantoinase B/oxoprolinase family protein [Rhodospirillales bacterium]
MNKSTAKSDQWQFWIDRGGTFTDIVAQRPDGSLLTHKLLSENPERYEDAAIQGIHDLLKDANEGGFSEALIESVKMGTTVATNALLERKGDRTVLLITKGFRDALRIGYQDRPHLFARHIQLPELLYERVIEVNERYSAQGEVLIPLNLENTRTELQQAYDDGIRSAAIVLVHGYRYHDHENSVAALARDIGFSQISVSHEVSPLMKLVGRGDTTVVDAYLSPILLRYVDQVASQLGDTQLMFMQSNGGLADARFFQGKDSILSGPAGGIVGAVRTAGMAGFDRLITFDMGGTSTDVAHFNGEYERAFDTQVAGVRIRAPMMRIHTVAAGGGSILHFDGQRYRVGPESAGADPGPACYRRGGPLTVTDANVMAGKIQAEFFPRVFGPEGDQILDADIVGKKFEALAAAIKEATGDERTAVEVADGFLMIAVDNMANAIKQISIQRGHDVTDYTLNCFGGAGGQHACLVADALGITNVFIHPFAGVLSAYGMGLAEYRVMRERAVESILDDALVTELENTLADMQQAGQTEMKRQGVDPSVTRAVHKLHLRYEGTDSPLEVEFADRAKMVAAFEKSHHTQYGFIAPEKRQIVEQITVEVIGGGSEIEESEIAVAEDAKAPQPLAEVEAYMAGALVPTNVFEREEMRPGCRVDGPAVIVEANATTVVEPGWAAEVTSRNHLMLRRVEPRPGQAKVGTELDPVMLELFNNLFMSAAEQMGETLKNTAYSVNIKERLDFSCAVFDPNGELVANAPHIPVHLGSMSESVRTVIKERQDTIKLGDVYMLNTPYNGGTHLPDITVITPVFDEAGNDILFYVATRGHHAEIGGKTPGSVPPDSKHIDEEGVLIDNFLLVSGGRLMEKETEELFTTAPYPTRNFRHNLADLQAQIAANEKGVQELRKMVSHFGLDVVHAYMQHVQDNAEECVRRILHVLKDGSFVQETDYGGKICVDIKVDNDKREAIIDFTGTSPQQSNNFNAPSSVCMAAVIYVFRLLVDEDIPLNGGCLKPLNVIIPEGCLLAPSYPAAVVAGNVETSQTVTNAILGALGIMGASQGTMNNFTFGNEGAYQNYETIAGGSGAGPDFDGTDAVHTHMTNTRATDAEILEWRFPVIVEAFSIRPHSGGKGKHMGGDGIIRRVRFREPMMAAISSSNRICRPYGMAGGEPGKSGRNYVERSDGTVEELAGADQRDMKAGDVFVIETPGGGGYEPPQ